MRTSRHAFHRRTVICLGLGLALLGHVQVNAQSVTAEAPFTNFMRNVTGANSATVSFAGAGTPVLSKAPTALGGTAGWSMASNFGTKVTASGGIDLATSGAVNVGKHSVPVTLTGTASKAATLAGMRTAFMGIARAGAGPLGMLFLLPAFTDWMASAGVERNPDHSNTDKPFLKTINDIQRFCRLTPSQSTGYANWLQSYRASDASGSATADAWTKIIHNQCVYGANTSTYWASGVRISGPTEREYIRVSKVEISGAVSLPASWDEVSGKWVNANFGAATLPSFIDETERIRKAHPNAGIDPFKVDLQFEKATGPATLPSLAPTTTTTTKVNPDGTTTTTTTKTTRTPTVEYTGNEVKVTDKDVTSTEEKTCTSTGTCTTTKPKPDEETQKPSEEETDLCKLHPEILACQELDTPDDEIPKSTREITYSEDTMFSGGGACPADKTMTLHTGQTVTVWNWQQSCDWITAYVRPILLVVASYIAVMMLVPKT